MVTKRGKRLIQIGLSSLYNRKINNSIRYAYRRVGQSNKERHSFRWQPQFSPNNVTEPEYMKKRTFSWITKRRSDMGQLPESTTATPNWPKSHRTNSDWRAAHYFWSWQRNEGNLRMDAETENPDETIKRFAKFYQKYIQEMDLPKWSRLAMTDLLNRIKTSGNNKIGAIKYKTTIRSSDGAAARSKEERLVYLAPHLNKAASKGLISSTPEEKEVMKILEKIKFPPRRAQQLDIKSGTPEAKMIESFIKSKQDTILIESHINKKAFVTKMGAGTDITMKRIFYRWKEATRNINMKKHKQLGKEGRYAELMSVLTTMKKDINDSTKDVELRGEAQRRFAKEAKKDKMYTYTIPTEAGDILVVKVKQSGASINLTGGVIPNVKDDMGTAATKHMLGASITMITKRVIDKLESHNIIMYDNNMMTYTESEAERLLWMRNEGSSVTENVFAPTFSVNIMTESNFAGVLSKVVNDAFGGYYNQGTWQDFFDPVSPHTQGKRNVFRQWSIEWIAKSISLTKELQEMADNDTNWKSWMKNKVKPGINPYSWSESVHIRPFIFSSKRGQLQREASILTAQGALLDYKGTLASL